MDSKFIFKNLRAHVNNDNQIVLEGFVCAKIMSAKTMQIFLEDDKVYDTEKDIFVVHNSDNKPFTVMMPVKDATNLYEMLEDAVGRLSESESDIEAFGDKAISFERLYDALEKSGVVGNSESAEEISEPISDDPSVCGHSEENCDAEDPSKLDPDSGNYEITSKDSF